MTAGTFTVAYEVFLRASKGIVRDSRRTITLLVERIGFMLAGRLLGGIPLHLVFEDFRHELHLNLIKLLQRRLQGEAVLIRSFAEDVF